MANGNDVQYRGVNYWVAMLLGWFFIVIGVLGFVWDPLFGLFHVNALHNVVHLASGAVLLAAAYVAGGRHARVTNLTLGVVYALVTLLGVVAPGFMEALIDISWNGGANPVWAIPDNWLHLAFTVILLSAALAERHRVDRPMHGAIR